MARWKKNPNKKLPTPTLDDPKRPMSDLRPDEWTFVDHYVHTILTGSPNATAAAIANGFKGKRPELHGHKMTKRPAIQKAVRSVLQKAAKKHEVTRDRLVEELAKVAFSNIDDFTILDDEGMRRIDLTNADRDHLAAVAEITVDTIKSPVKDDPDVLRVRMKLHDKLTAIDKLARSLGMFEADRGVNVNILINENDMRAI